MPHGRARRALTALVLLLGGGCRLDDSGRPIDARPPDDAAAAPDQAVTDAATDQGDGDATACVVRAPPAVFATWPMPDSTGGGHAPAPKYDTSTAGVVNDLVTGLGWQRAVDAGQYGWTDAASYCACLSLGGWRDWRLPTRIELVSLVDAARATPAIDGDAFPDTPPEWFWTSSPAADQPGAAWYVAFFDGDAHEMDKATTYRVRCVRGGAAGPARRFTVGADGIVADAATGLSWQRAIDDVFLTWGDAGTACAGLRLGGHADWRLPTAKELQTLIDDTRADPAIDPDAFPDAPADSFWAATPLGGPDGAGYAWFVSFATGIAYNSPVAAPHRARCVR